MNQRLHQKNATETGLPDEVMGLFNLAGSPRFGRIEKATWLNLLVQELVGPIAAELLVDEDDMQSDLDDKAPTQQSVAAYVRGLLQRGSYAADYKSTAAIDIETATLDTANPAADTLTTTLTKFAAGSGNSIAPVTGEVYLLIDQASTAQDGLWRVTTVTATEVTLARTGFVSDQSLASLSLVGVRETKSLWICKPTGTFASSTADITAVEVSGGSGGPQILNQPTAGDDIDSSSISHASLNGTTGHTLIGDGLMVNFSNEHETDTAEVTASGTTYEIYPEDGLTLFRPDTSTNWARWFGLLLLALSLCWPSTAEAQRQVRPAEYTTAELATLATQLKAKDKRIVRNSDTNQLLEWDGSQFNQLAASGSLSVIELDASTAAVTHTLSGTDPVLLNVVDVTSGVSVTSATPIQGDVSAAGDYLAVPGAILQGGATTFTQFDGAGGTANEIVADLGWTQLRRGADSPLTNVSGQPAVQWRSDQNPGWGSMGQAFGGSIGDNIGNRTGVQVSLASDNSNVTDVTFHSWQRGGGGGYSFTAVVPLSVAQGWHITELDAAPPAAYHVTENQDPIAPYTPSLPTGKDAWQSGDLVVTNWLSSVSISVFDGTAWQHEYRSKTTAVEDLSNVGFVGNQIDIAEGDILVKSSDGRWVPGTLVGAEFNQPTVAIGEQDLTAWLPSGPAPAPVFGTVTPSGEEDPDGAEAYDIEGPGAWIGMQVNVTNAVEFPEGLRNNETYTLKTYVKKSATPVDIHGMRVVLGTPDSGSAITGLLSGSQNIWTINPQTGVISQEHDTLQGLFTLLSADGTVMTGRDINGTAWDAGDWWEVRFNYRHIGSDASFYHYRSEYRHNNGATTNTNSNGTIRVGALHFPYKYQLGSEAASTQDVAKDSVTLAADFGVTNGWNDVNNLTLTLPNDGDYQVTATLSAFGGGDDVLGAYVLADGANNELGTVQFTRAADLSTGDSHDIPVTLYFEVEDASAGDIVKVRAWQADQANDTVTVRAGARLFYRQTATSTILNTTDLPAENAANLQVGDTLVWDGSKLARQAAVTTTRVTTINATNFAQSGSANTVSYDTDTPGTGETVIRTDLGQYVQVGKLRYYDLRLITDDDDAVSFTVPDSVFITNVQINTSVSGGTSWESPGMTTSITGANTFAINRDNDVNSDTNVQLSFIAHMP